MMSVFQTLLFIALLAVGFYMLDLLFKIKWNKLDDHLTTIQKTLDEIRDNSKEEPTSPP